MRKTSVLLAVLGVLVLAAAAVLRLVVLPAQAQLPSDTDTTRSFSGTAAVVLNAAALQSGDVANAVLTDVPITIDRVVRAEDTDGSRAIVRDSRTVELTQGGQQIAASDAVYAVDRKELTEAEPFGDTDVVDHQGITVSFPIGTEKTDHVGWIADTQSTTPLTYEGTSRHEGIDTYEFSSAVPTTPIDTASVTGLPPAIPKSALAALAPSLGLSSDQLTSVTAVLAQLPDPVPLGYTYSGETTYWVEPVTGTVVDLERSETRSATVSVGGVAIPLAPVLDMTYAMTDDSVAEAVSDATDAKNALGLLGTIGPAALLVLGLLLLGLAVYTSRRGGTSYAWMHGSHGPAIEQLPDVSHRTPSG